MSDFEKAMKTSVALLFDQIEIKGCWFHFNKALIKRVFGVGK